MNQNIPKTEISKKTVLITGASNGIGLEFAHLFAKNNINLVLVARSESKLKNLANEVTQNYKIDAKVIPMDLAQPGASENLFNKTLSLGIHIDFLINNAGFGSLGFFKDIGLKKHTEMIQLNTVALTELTQLYLEPMLDKKFGKILNVASIAAYQPGPLMTVYYATKAYVLSFSEGLSNELKGTGVSVTALCPGPTLTGFQTVAQFDNQSRLFHNSLVADSASVALAGYQGMFSGQTIVIPGFINKISACSAKLFPRKLSAKVARWLQEKRN